MNRGKSRTITSLTDCELKRVAGGAIWIIPVAKAVGKGAGALLSTAAAYDGARDFVRGYRECR